MNLSGTAVVPLLQFYKIEIADLLVIVDEVQLETGRIRVRPSGSAGGGNGPKTIIGTLGTRVFPRPRVGVGRGDGQSQHAGPRPAKFGGGEREGVAEARA